MAWPHAAEVTVDSYTTPVGFVVPGASGILTNRATGVAAVIYSDRDRTLTLNTTGQVKLDGNGNLSGVFTDPGRYRLAIGTSLIDVTVYPDPDDLGTGGGTPASSVTGPDAFGSPSVVGTSPNYARQDHDHGLPAGPAGSTPASSVTGPDSFGAASVVGTSTNFARQDHDHGLPAAPSVPSAASSVTGPDALGASATVGTSTNYARQDHDHGHQSAAQTAAGLLLFGTHAARPAAGAGNANLYYFETDTGALFQNQSGSAWTQIGPGAASTVTGPDAYGASPNVGTSTAFARADHDHGLPTATPGTPASTVTGPDAYGATSAVGTSSNYAREDHDHGLPAATPGIPASSVTGPDAFGAAAVVGTSTAYARQDHDHGLPVNRATLTPTAVKTANYTAVAGDLVLVDTTSGAITVTLPSAPADKVAIGVKMITQGGTNAVSVVRSGTDVFNKTGGPTSISLPSLSQERVFQYQSSTGIWIVLGDDTAGGAGATYATPTIALGTAGAAGVATTGIRSDSTITAFDATAPSTQAFADTAVVGTAAVAARRDHKHAMPANPVSFATPTLALGTAGAAGAASTVIRSDATIVAFDATAPVTQAFGDAAAVGAATVAARRDHTHGMPAAPLRVPHLVVAASNANATWKNRADYLCDGTADEVEINAAITALATNGGVVELSDGVFTTAAAIALASRITLVGQGPNATTLHRSGTATFITLNGTATGSANHVSRGSIRHMTIDGQGSAGVAIMSHYSDTFFLEHLQVTGCLGEGLQLVEAWDSTIVECRFITCGTTNGTGTPAVGIYQTLSGVASSDNCNNLRFYGCTIEAFTDCALKVIGTGTGAVMNYSISFQNCKIETVVGIRGHEVILDYTERVTFRDTFFYHGPFASGFSTASDTIHITNSISPTIEGCSFVPDNGSRSLRSYIALYTNVVNAWIAALDMQALSVNFPTVAGIDNADTAVNNYNNQVDVYDWSFDGHGGSVLLNQGVGRQRMIYSPTTGDRAGPQWNEGSSGIYGLFHYQGTSTVVLRDPVNSRNQVIWTPGASSSAATVEYASKVQVDDLLTVQGNVDISTAGKGLQIKEGTNAKMGVSTLAAGTIVVSTTAVTASSRIFLTCQTPGGTPGFLRVSARTAGTSFTILSSSGTDTSVVAWMIVEPG